MFFGSLLQEENEGLRAHVVLLREALNLLLYQTMYKDHPEISQMAIDALKQTGGLPDA